MGKTRTLQSYTLGVFFFPQKKICTTSIQKDLCIFFNYIFLLYYITSSYGRKHKNGERTSCVKGPLTGYRTISFEPVGPCQWAGGDCPLPCSPTYNFTNNKIVAGCVLFIFGGGKTFQTIRALRGWLEPGSVFKDLSGRGLRWNPWQAVNGWK